MAARLGSFQGISWISCGNATESCPEASCSYPVPKSYRRSSQCRAMRKKAPCLTSSFKPDLENARATSIYNGNSSVYKYLSKNARIKDSLMEPGSSKAGTCRCESPSATEPMASKELSSDWADLDAELSYMTRTVRLVQWYPGHIARAERALKEQLKWVDVVIEVRDARIPQATSHPELDSWIGERKKVLVLNREDMVSAADRNAWASFYASQGTPPVFTDGQHGGGINRLTRAATAVGEEINRKRRAKGLLPRPVRAAAIGFPNVGKSALINRLLRRRMCASAPRPGVTRDVKWLQIGQDLDLLDAPGVLPARIADQAAAARLAICNDIGEAAYAVAGVAAILVEMLKRMPTAGSKVLEKRYKVSPEGMTGEVYMELLSDRLFQGDVNQAGQRVLRDFRKGYFGPLALERPPPRATE